GLLVIHFYQAARTSHKLKTLQLVQNAAARVLTRNQEKRPYYSSIGFSALSPCKRKRIQTCKMMWSFWPHRSSDLQLSLGQFAAKCESAGMRISTELAIDRAKSKPMVLSRKRVDCPLRVGEEFLPQVEEFKYLGVLFTNEGKNGAREGQTDRCSICSCLDYNQ
ncbi:hypothetical protein L3Q82_017030, partial [Scortum barcoo]